MKKILLTLLLSLGLALTSEAQTTSKIVTNANATGQTGAMQTGPRAVQVSFTFCGTGFTGALAVDSAATSASLAEVWTTSLSGNSNCATTYAPVATKWYRVRWTRTAGVLNVWMTSTPATGGSSLPAFTGHAGEVLAVNVTETAAEWIAVAGTGTVTSVGISAPSIFSVADSPVIAAGTIAISLATQAANLVWAGPATGADAAPTFRALVAADLGSFTLSPSLRLLTLQDATGDTTPLTVRASSGVGTAHIAQFQASDNSPLSHIAHDGSFVGAVIGNASTATTAGAVTTVVASKLLGRGSAGGDGVSQDITLGTNLSMSGTTLNATGGGGITNSAGANVLPKSDGTNLVASAISEASAGSLATSAGTALGLTATAPAATTGASQAGIPVTITASPAVASTDTAGAAAGGIVGIYSGAAARLTSGNASGGGIALSLGAPVGTSKRSTISDDGMGGRGVRLGSQGGSNACLSWNNPAISAFYGSLSTHGVNLPVTSVFGWGATEADSSSAPATQLRYRGSGNPAWGAAAASPVAYTHNFAADARAATDTNTRGAAADLAPGVGTGTGGSGQLALQTAYPGSTGTAANTLTDRVFLESVWTDLTESSATNFSKLSFAASTAVGAEWLVTVSANDGTEYQSLTSRVRVSSVRKATGDTVSEINVVGTDLTAASSGTLTCTFTDVEGAAGVTVAANCVSSLTQTVLRISYQTTVNGPATVGAP